MHVPSLNVPRPLLLKISPTARSDAETVMVRVPLSVQRRGPQRTSETVTDVSARLTVKSPVKVSASLLISSVQPDSWLMVRYVRVLYVYVLTQTTIVSGEVLNTSSEVSVQVDERPSVQGTKPEFGPWDHQPMASCEGRPR